MSEIIIPHTLFKYNWRFAQLQVTYKTDGTTGRATAGYIRWYSSKGVLSAVPQPIATTSGGNIQNLYGLPTTWPFQSRTTTVNNNDDNRAKTTSRILGYGTIAAVVPFHVYHFRIPVGQEVTYGNPTWAGNMAYYSTIGYIECEFLGEQ